MSSYSIQEEIVALERAILEKESAQQTLVRELDIAQKERESSDSCLEAARLTLEKLPSLNTLFSQSYSKFHALKDQRLLELQVAEAELIAAENALRWQVEEQHESSKRVNTVASELRERYIKAKRDLRMFDPEIFRKLDVVEAVEAEQRCEITKIEEVLSIAERLSGQMVTAQRRAESASQAGLNDTFREAHDFLSEGSLSMPTAECRIPVPPGKLRFLTSSFADQGSQGFGMLRKKYLVHIAVEDRGFLSLLVAGHVNGVRKCVADIDNVLSMC
jgi:hypothetical protein